MGNYHLSDFCFPKEAEEDSDFVGIHFNDGDFRIVFPIGFTPSINNEKELKKEILLLISVLRHYRPEDKKKKANENEINNLQNFPLYAYIYVFNYFMKNGYYITKEKIYKKNTTGKINWKRTIKEINPIINNGNVVYLEYITNKINYNDEELITLINKYCVYETFEKIGCLFTSYKPKNPNIKFRERLFKSFLKQKIEQTFNDDDRALFQNMLDIINHVNKDSEKKEYFYGTNEFHIVWEQMIDDVFGDKKKGAKYHPHIFWNIENNEILTSTLIPDTLMFDKEQNKAYILDAKYYRAGNNLNVNHLPSTESVPKQLVYAKRLENNDELKLDGEKIYNAFILPYESKNTDNIEYLGWIRPDWVNTNELTTKPYNRIQGIKLDVKTLMGNHVSNDKLVQRVIEIIEEGCKKSKDIS